MLHNFRELDQPLKVYNRCVKDLAFAKHVLHTPELLSMLTSRPLCKGMDDTEEPFLPPEQGKARSAGSLLAELCRRQAKIAMLVITNPKWSSLLHEFDMYCSIAGVETRDDVNSLLEARGLWDKCDQRYLDSLLILPVLN